MGNPLLKGSGTDSRQDLAQKQPVQKMPRPYVSKIHLLILQHLLEWEKTVRTLSGRKALAGTIFVIPSSLANAGGDRHHKMPFLLLPF